MSRIEHVCRVENAEAISFSTLVAATAAWLVVLAAALVVKLVAGGGWSDPGPALLLAAAPVAAALVLKIRREAGWSLLVAAAILGGATLFPSLLFKEWGETVFEMGGSAGYLIILLAYYRNQGWRIIIPTLIMAGIMLGATALSIRF